MERLKVRFRPEAPHDLLAIYSYVLDVSRGVSTSRGFVQRIRARCERIGNVPYGGRPRDDLEPGLRTVPFEKSAVIAYKVEGKFVRITNIFYGGRNYEASIVAWRLITNRSDILSIFPCQMASSSDSGRLPPGSDTVTSPT